MCPIIKSELREKLRSAFITRSLCPDCFQVFSHDDKVYACIEQTVSGDKLYVQSPYFATRDGATYLELIVREMVRHFEHELQARGWRPPTLGDNTERDRYGSCAHPYFS